MQIDLTVISLLISVISRDFKSVLMFIGHFVCCLKKKSNSFPNVLLGHLIFAFAMKCRCSSLVTYIFMYVVHKCMLHPLRGFSLSSWCVLVHNVVSLHPPISVFFFYFSLEVTHDNLPNQL